MSRAGGVDGRISPKIWTQARTELEALQTEQQQEADALLAKLPDPEAPRPTLWRRATREIGEALGWRDASVTPEQYEDALNEVSEIDAVMRPLEGLVAAARQRSVDPGRMSTTKLETLEREALERFEALEALETALAAAGPAVASHFPRAQLDLLKVKLRGRLNDLTGERLSRAGEAPSRPAPTRAAPATEAPREPAPLEDKRLAGRPRPAPTASPTERLGFRWRREPPPIPESVILKPSALEDGPAAAKTIGERLGAPELTAAATAALDGTEGADRARLEAALKGYAALADFATGSPDYARTGVSMFGAPRDRRSHQARAYGRTADASKERQDGSRDALARALTAALGQAEPAAATEAALTEHFLREIGVPARDAADWHPTAAAVTQALDDELFVPLRALNETMHMARARAPREAMVDAVRDATRAVVEGRYAEWKHTRPTSQQQLAHLDEAQQQRWLGTEPRETKGEDGQTIVTREAEGHEAFWATKVGGPSHAFDTMNWCILSLLGNARTKAIVVGDSEWHQPAGRAYLRLVKDRDDTPIVYLDNLEVDFPYRDTHASRRGALSQAALDHALAKAKALGAGLAVATDLNRLRQHGLEPEPFPGALVLEPSGMVVEAADTYGPGHDWDQRLRMEVATRAAYVPPEAVAAWNG